MTNNNMTAPDLHSAIAQAFNHWRTIRREKAAKAEATFAYDRWRDLCRMQIKREIKVATVRKDA